MDRREAVAAPTLEQLGREILELKRERAQLARRLARWRRGGLALLGAAALLGLAGAPGLRALRAQDKAPPPEGVEGVRALMDDPFGPGMARGLPPLISLGTHVLNVNAISYFYYTANGAVVYFSGCPAVGVGKREADALRRLVGPVPEPVPPPRPPHPEAPGS